MPPFQYRTYQDPYIGSVLDLMGRRTDARARSREAVGAIRAQEAQAKAQATGQMVSGLANVAGQAYAGYTTAQEDKIAQDLLQEIHDRPEVDAGPGYLSRAVPGGVTPPPFTRDRPQLGGMPFVTR